MTIKESAPIRPHQIVMPVRTAVLASERLQKIVLANVGQFSELDDVDHRLAPVEATDVGEIFRAEFRSVGIGQQEDHIGLKREGVCQCGEPIGSGIGLNPVEKLFCQTEIAGRRGKHLWSVATTAEGVLLQIEKDHLKCGRFG